MVVKWDEHTLWLMIRNLVIAMKRDDHTMLLSSLTLIDGL